MITNECIDEENEYAINFKLACDKLRDVKNFQLTARETEVLVLLASGMTVYKISEFLCREKTTVYKHLENARAKMQCASLVSLGVQLAKLLN